MKKTFNLDTFCLTPTELANRNITDIPTERMYYSSYGNRQIVIHDIQGKFYIYVMNFLPEYYIKNHYKEYAFNKWIRLCGFKDIEDAKRIYRMYLKEMIKNTEKSKITLHECIKYLQELEKIKNELQ